MTAFDCNRCGACCRLVGATDVGKHLDRGDGACKHLAVNEDGSHHCEIYETRPAFCRVDEGTPPHMTVAEWQRLNAEACKVLRLKVYGGA